MLSDADAVRIIGDELVRAGALREPSGAFLEAAMPELRARVSLLSECAPTLSDMLSFPLDELANTKEGRDLLADDAVRETARLLVFAQSLGTFSQVSSSTLHDVTQAICEARGIAMADVWQPLRTCLTANTSGIKLHTLFKLLCTSDDNVMLHNVGIAGRIDKLREKLGI
eukprot:NODE_25479_length_585_cov_15.131004.p1 GENE.NODE_25479_length_585_cov_15.131004~~NODE_25479_length_585_cov_15.131004.p1  ORF type:complete len:170 (-),score=43.74 NODE_25479_length_585_cov_15.131004:75-584(-)